METQTIKLLAFGMLAEHLGFMQQDFSLPADTDSFLSKLKGQFPILADLKFSIAVNRKMVTSNTLLNAGDEVALLPPFSGG